MADRIRKALTEERVADRVSRYLSRRNYFTVREVPVISKKLDIVAAKKGSEEIVGIEVKITNWRRALQQAMFYRLCCHRVYIALWEGSSHLIDSALLSKYGIGLISVDGSLTELSKARKSSSLHRSLVRLVRIAINEHMNGST